MTRLPVVVFNMSKNHQTDTLHILKIGLLECALDVHNLVQQENELVEFLNTRAKLFYVPCTFVPVLLIDLQKDVDNLLHLCARFCKGAESVTTTGRCGFFYRPSAAHVKLPPPLKQLTKGEIEWIYKKYVRLFLVLDKVDKERQTYISGASY